jgi:hypothetical protein
MFPRVKKERSLEGGGGSDQPECPAARAAIDLCGVLADLFGRIQ